MVIFRDTIQGRNQPCGGLLFRKLYNFSYKKTPEILKDWSIFKVDHPEILKKEMPQIFIFCQIFYKYIL